MSEVLPERNVVVSAILLIFVGASSSTLLVLGIFEDALLLDTSILAIPIGYGLLVGSENSRCLARLGSGILLVVAVAGLVVIAVFAIRGWELEGLTWSTGLPALIWALLGLLVFRSLRVKRVGDWFREKRSPAFARSCTPGVVLVAVAFTVEEYVRLREYYSQMDRAFPVRVQIRLVDAETGAGVRSVILPAHAGRSGSGPLSHSFNYSRPSVFPKLGYGTTGTRDGMVVTAEGILLEPTRIVIAADGYKGADILLSRTTEASIRLPLVRDESEPTGPPDSPDVSASREEDLPSAR